MVGVGFRFEHVQSYLFREEQVWKNSLGWEPGTCWITRIEALPNLSSTALAATFTLPVHYGSGSKANRLRAFWQKEENSVVGKLMGDMLEYAGGAGALEEVCRRSLRAFRKTVSLLS